MQRFFAACAALVLAFAAHGQGKDELWEVTSQMNMAGLPPGMGASTAQVCRDKDPKKDATASRDMKDCKVTDVKESGNRFTVTMTCREGTAVFDQTYNAARTEFKGTMRMQTRDGDMTMNMSGRKIGACDAQQAGKERDAKVAAAKKKGDEGMAMLKKAQDEQIASCQAAPRTMDLRKLGQFGMCHHDAKLCDIKQVDEANKRVGTACIASHSELCKRYQTLEGFDLAKGERDVADSCKLSRDQVRAPLCERGAKDENLMFLARYCPVEGKPLAQKHCAGFDFTSKAQTKYSDFCRTYLKNRDLEKPPATQAQKAKEAVTDGVNTGINKLKGLFGR